jgi:hydrogenase-4 component B
MAREGAQKLMIPFLIGTALFASGGLCAAFVRGRLKRILYAGSAALAQGFILPGTISVLTGGDSLSLPVSLAFPIGAAWLRLDPLAAFFVLIISLGGVLSAVYSIGYMRGHANRGSSLSRYDAFQGILVASMLLVVTVQNALLFLIVWEIMSLASFFLVSFDDRDESVRRAGLYYLVSMQVGAGFLIAAFAWTATLAGSLDFASFGAVLGPPSGTSVGLFLLFLAGFGTKAGLVPMHTWLPLAHPAAPTGISALMSGVMIKTGIYGLLRIVLLGGGRSALPAYIVFFVSLATGVFGVINAAARRDMKELLAFSSIENVGIIGMGIGIGMLGLVHGMKAAALFGFFGALLHVFNHFAFKSLLFYGAGTVYIRTGTRNIDRLGGLIRAIPATSALFLLGSLAIAGLPLFNGFISEFAVYMGLLRSLSGGNLLLNVAVLGGLAGLAFIGVVAVLSFTKLFGVAFLGTPRTPGIVSSGKESAAMLAPMIVMGLFILAIGLVPLGTLPFLGPVVRPFLPGGAPAEWARLVELFRRISPAVAGMGGLTLFFLAVRRALLRGKPVAEFKTWDCGSREESLRCQYTASSFAAPFLRLVAPIVPQRRRVEAPDGPFPGRASYESHSEDAIGFYLIRPVGGWIRRFLGMFTWIQSGQTQQYILYGLIFLVILIVWIIGVR